jgi:hypothetical protein
MDNQVYLRKLIQQETVNVKYDLFKENIIDLYKDYQFIQRLKTDHFITKQIQDRVLLEHFNSKVKIPLNEVSYESRSSENLDIKQVNIEREKQGKKPISTWEEQGLKEAAIILEEMGGIPFLAGENPYGYELDTSILSMDIVDNNTRIDTKNTGATDRLWFYTNGRVWSTNQRMTMGWKYTSIGDNFFKNLDDDIKEQVKETFEDFGIDVHAQYICIFNTSESSTITIVPTRQNGLIRKGTATGKYPEKSIPVVTAGGKINEPEYMSFDFVQTLDKLKTSEAEQEADNDFLNGLQTALDWLGTVPVVGDVIDVINAVIYFIRYAWSGFRVNSFLYQGLLSCIAIIPIIGSGISLILKGLISKIAKFGRKGAQVFKWLFFGKKVDKIADSYRLMQKFGVKAEHLKSMGIYMTKFGRGLQKAINYISKVPGFGWLRKSPFPEVAESMGKHSDAVVKLEREFVKDGAKAEVKFGKGFTLNPNNARKAYEKNAEAAEAVAGGLWKKLKSGNLWPSKKFQQVADTLTNNYKRSAAKNASETFVTLSKESQDLAIKGLQKDKQLMKQYDNLFASSKAASKNRKSSKFGLAVKPDAPSGLKKLLGKEKGNLTHKELEETFAYLSKPGSGISPKQAAEFSAKLRSGIADQAVDLGHITYQAHRNSSLKQLQAAMWNTSSAAGFWKGKVNPFTALASSGKTLDVIYNEAENVAEDLGIRWETEGLDMAQGVVIPLIQMGVEEWLPGVDKTLESGAETVKGIIGVAKETLPDVAGYFADMLGVDSGQFKNYKPQDKDYKSDATNTTFSE